MLGAWASAFPCADRKRDDRQRTDTSPRPAHEDYCGHEFSPPQGGAGTGSRGDVGWVIQSQRCGMDLMNAPPPETTAP